MRRFRPASPGNSAPDDADPGRRRPGSEQDSEAVSLKAIEIAAVRLLARREHSSEELGRKLESKGYPAEGVEAVVAKLREKRLVSDDRFASSFVHHHAQRGQGPIRIRAELRQQGVADALIEAQLKGADLDWVALAQATRKRKFGGDPPRNLAERAKQARFLQYRGFNSDQIRAALKSGMESCDSVTDGDAGLDLD
jgi:regulatory protein